MKRLALSLCLIALLAPAAWAARELGSLEGAWPRGATREVRIDFPVGELRLETSDDATIRATLWVRCQRNTDACVERSRNLKLVTDEKDGVRTIELKGYPRTNNKGLQVELVIQVPKGLDVDVDMGVGEAIVRGLDGEVRVNLGVGEVNVRMPQQGVGDVKLGVGVGEVSLAADGRSRNGSGFLGHSLKWTGKGAKRVDVECGVGEVSVRLD